MSQNRDPGVTRSSLLAKILAIVFVVCCVWAVVFVLSLPPEIETTVILPALAVMERAQCLTDRCPHCSNEHSVNIVEESHEGVIRYAVVCDVLSDGCGMSGPVSDDWNAAVTGFNNQTKVL